MHPQVGLHHHFKAPSSAQRLSFWHDGGGKGQDQANDEGSIEHQNQNVLIAVHLHHLFSILLREPYKSRKKGRIVRTDNRFCAKEIVAWSQTRTNTLGQLHWIAPEKSEVETKHVTYGKAWGLTVSNPDRLLYQVTTAQTCSSQAQFVFLQQSHRP